MSFSKSDLSELKTSLSSIYTKLLDEAKESIYNKIYSNGYLDEESITSFHQRAVDEILTLGPSHEELKYYLDNISTLIIFPALVGELNIMTNTVLFNLVNNKEARDKLKSLVTVVDFND